MNNNASIVSMPLISIPFLSSTDSNRMQMAGKQASQSLPSKNCVRPYCISNKWEYLSDNCKLYKYVTNNDGVILFKNNDFIIFIDGDEYKIFDIYKYQQVFTGYALELRYLTDLNTFDKFEANTLLFEYSGFIENVPASGYNLKTLYSPFFGYTFEDGVVISESFAKNASYVKTESIIIPIYTYSMFKHQYNSKYKIFPDIGEKINSNIVSTLYSKSISNDDFVKNITDSNIISFLESKEDTNNGYSITSKIQNGEVYEIRIHKINNKKILDLELSKILNETHNEYLDKINLIKEELSDFLDETIIKKLIGEKYTFVESRQIKKLKDIYNEYLVYLIEIKVKKEYGIHIGDKITNRYANKGVVSYIIPDKLRPLTTEGEPIDIIVGSVTPINRMNYGQLIEGFLSKAIRQCEKNILTRNVSLIQESLDKLVIISDFFYGKNSDYSNKIKNLKNKTNFNDLVYSIQIGGLYFECPLFSSIDLNKLQDILKKEFDIDIVEDTIFSKELINYMNEKSGVDIIINNDKILHKMYVADIHWIRLNKIASSITNARDIGDYKNSNGQPTSDRLGRNRASTLGEMENKALAAHGAENAINEIRSVKSDSGIEPKYDLFEQYLTFGKYKIKEYDVNELSKLNINSCMEFLKNNGKLE